MGMTTKELDIDIEAVVSKCHGDEIPVTVARKKIIQTFIQFCEENNICQVVEGELPEVPLWATRDGTEIRGADAVFKLALQDMKLWHKQSLKPVSSLLEMK